MTKFSYFTFRLLQSISQRLLNLNQVPSTSGTSSLEASQEIDIDILQVQETVTVDTDGDIEFSCKDSASSCNSISAADLTTELLQVRLFRI